MAMLQADDRANAGIASTAPGSDDETPMKDTIKVTPRKEMRPNGTVKLKRPAPKHNKPGNWRDGSVIDGSLPHLSLVCPVGVDSRALRASSSA